MQRDWVLPCGGGGQWGNSWPWGLKGCWELRRACVALIVLQEQGGWDGGVRSQSTCRWPWHKSWHFASPASPCAPSHLCPAIEKETVKEGKIQLNWRSLTASQSKGNKICHVLCSYCNVFKPRILCFFAEPFHLDDFIHTYPKIWYLWKL